MMKSKLQKIGRGNLLYLKFLQVRNWKLKLELELICFSFAHIGPRNLMPRPNGKSIVGDEEEVEDIEEEGLSVEDEND